jgi:beta-galactosidase
MHARFVFVACVVALSAGPSVAAGRQTELFDKDWKFQIGDNADAAKADFDDSSWRKVNLPHDYSIEGPAGKDPASMDGPFDKVSPAGGGGGFLDAPTAWYRKTFTVPASAKGERVSILFDGVYMNSDVYLNGKKLGNHPYGYTPFIYDLTNDLKFDGPNTLAVRCEVQQPCSRWYSGAGIYRHVYLVTTEPVHIAPWGTYLTADKDKANGNDFWVTVRTTLRNDSDKSVKCKTTTAIHDAGVRGDSPPDESGKKIPEAASTEQTIPAGGEVTLYAVCHVADPHLWSPDSPYMYRAVTTVTQGDKKIDTATDPLGFRTFEFTKDDGFHLNGKRLQIQGTCNHHDLGALGSAVNRRALERQLQMLKDMGNNALRTSHNPPAPEFLELADELGFVVMDEAFDEWKAGKTRYGYGRFFDDWSERDIVTMIHRDRNHPSIVMWSIGNEIGEQRRPEGGAMAQRLANITHREDPSRPTVSACNNPNQAVPSGFADALDVMGINYNIGNYERNKGRVLIASETASALSTRGEYGLYLNDDGEVKIRIRPNTQCTSYDLDKPQWGSTAETSLIALKNSPWVAGEFVWTGFDYIGEPTPHPWPARSSYFGIIDLAGFPKDRFYIYQSQWSKKPMVHLLPHWNWEGWEGKEIPVQAYTNADSVELFLNGKSLGAKQDQADLARVGDRQTLHYEWKVPYAAGTLKAVAKKDGQVVATDEVVTAGAPVKLELKADRSAINADGDDLAFVTVRVLDKDGHICPNADNKILFSLDGPAKIAGLDNGDPINHESFQGTSHKAFHGLALAIVRAQDAGGTAKLTATTPGLESGSASIELKAAPSSP